MAQELKTYEEAQDLLKQLIIAECYRRVELYGKMRIGPNDSKQLQQEKAQFLIDSLHYWKHDAVAWLNDMAWAPDPKGTFGSRSIPDELAPWVPKGMVPFIPFKVQTDLAKAWDRILRGDLDGDISAVKSRQVFFTGEFCWLGLREFLFHGSSPGLLGSYGEQFIDEGGKGQREATSLFGRMRMFLDAVVHCLPALKFNAHLYPKGRGKGPAFNKWQASSTGFRDTDDISFKMSRPRWTVFGVRMFQEAEGNWMRGALPSDNFGRSYTARWALMDELPAYNKALGSGKDRAAWNACNQNVFMRAGWGTIPEDGGPGSMLYTLMEESDNDPTLTQIWCHWSDITPYMAGAMWVCRRCAGKTDYKHPDTNAIQPGPGRKGVSLLCGECKCPQQVSFKDMWSPWFERMCQKMKWDKVGIARELQMDWMAAQGDVLFSPIDASNLVQPFKDQPTFMSYDGHDPGYTIENPGAWWLSRFDPRTLKHHIVGYWMASNAMAEYWVPFFKRWDRKAVARNRILYGKFSGQTFQQAFEYPDEALTMLDHCSHFPMGHIEADKFVSHHLGSESAFDILSRYGVVVSYIYTKDREELVRAGVEWSACVIIDEKIAEIKPPTPLNKLFPSAVQVFTTSKPKPHGGQGVCGLDVDKQNPPHVNNGADAWFYLVRGVGADHPHAMSDPSGHFSTEAMRDAEVVEFTDSSMWA